MSQFERMLYEHGYRSIAGVDEAGRGPLAGPVVAAACILPADFFLAGLNDSKQLTAEKREELYCHLIKDPTVFFGIGVVDASEIDRINILQATFLAMRKAISSLSKTPDYILVDGNALFRTKIPATALVNGDARSISIAAASIFAKVTRDRMMDEFDRNYPLYGFKKHKGYATLEHVAAIEKHGICPIHRQSFDPIKSSLEPSFFNLWND